MQLVRVLRVLRLCMLRLLSRLCLLPTVCVLGTLLFPPVLRPLHLCLPVAGAGRCFAAIARLLAAADTYVTALAPHVLPAGDGHILHGPSLRGQVLVVPAGACQQTTCHCASATPPVLPAFGSARHASAALPTSAP